MIKINKYIINKELFLLKGIFILCFSIFASCKKEDPKPDPKPDPADPKEIKAEVYVAGSNSKRIILWKNGEKAFMSNEAYNVSASALFVSGADVYIGGVEFDKVTNKFITKLWKNGVETVIPTKSYYEPISSIYVAGSDVYLLIGDAEGASVNLWKNGTITPLASSSIAGSFLKDESDLFCFFTDFNDFSNIHTKFWSNGNLVDSPTKAVSTASSRSSFKTGKHQYHINTLQNLDKSSFVLSFFKDEVKTEILNTNKPSEATAIFVHGEDVYITWNEGYYSNRITAVLWKNGVSMPLSDTTEQSMANAIFVK